jgi:ElaB/YqjD/DUF883 family membrane-anchored ribosome-binding protein
MDTSLRNDQTGETATGCQSSGESCACGNIKTALADKMHKVAAVVGEKAASQDAQPAMAQYGKQAAEVLEKSADFLQQFDSEQADAKLREYVRQNLGPSLLIAGVTGLIIGVIFRRR